jgi:signal transduction histidine kinase
MKYTRTILVQSQNIIIIFLILISKNLHAQNTTTLLSKWDTLNNLYDKGQYTKEQYLDTLDFFAQQNLTDPDLENKLKKFKDLVWADKKQQFRKEKYYYYLSVMSRLTDRPGLTIFYMEKMAELREEKKPYLAPIFFKANLMFEQKRYSEAIAEYKSVENSINELPDKILTDTAYINSRVLTYVILPVTIMQCYVHLNDTAGAIKALQLGDAIFASFNKRKKFYSRVFSLTNQFNLMCNYHFNLFAGKLNIAEMDIKESLKMCLEDYKENLLNLGPVITQLTKHDILIKHIEFYLATKNFDSARKYLELLKIHLGQSPEITPFEEDVFALQLEAQFLSATKNFDLANINLQKISKLKDSILYKVNNDAVENMYARVQSDYTQAQLIEADIANEKNSTTIILITILSLCAIIAGVLYSVRLKRNTIIKINNFDISTKMQILELEEENRKRITEEQKTIAMDIHDAIAGDLASIKIKLETLAYETDHQNIKTKIDQYVNLVSKTYEKARNISHDWYSGKEGDEFNFPFEKNAIQIINIGLPDRDYNKQIQISDEDAVRLPVYVKLELLRVLQEGILNIVKHAKANSVKVKLQKSGTLIDFSIEDNGKGFFNSQFSGIGLKAIKTRLERMNGQLKITSTNNGTILNAIIDEQKISIPD